MARQKEDSKLNKEELESLLDYIFSVADECGGTKSELEEAIEEISSLTDPDAALSQDDEGNWTVDESAETEDEEEEE